MLAVENGLDWWMSLHGMVIGIAQPPPTDGTLSALFSNLSKSALDIYVAKGYNRPLLEEVSWSRLPCPIPGSAKKEQKQEQTHIYVARPRRALK